VRAIAIIGWFVVVIFAAAAPVAAQRAPEPQALSGFAQRIGLSDVTGFVETVQSLRSDRRLPPRYVTKGQAQAHGWHGGGLCTIWPGHVIGGDLMRNFGGKLPDRAGRYFYEADLDSDCHSRGPKRLVFSSDGLIYLTVDHYNSFTPVP
jgi:ribonuclease T1